MPIEKISVNSHIARVSDVYPLLWLGENGYAITRYGRLYMLDGEPLGVEYVAKLSVPQRFNPGVYIVGGGVKLGVYYVLNVVKAVRDAVKYINVGETLAAAGLKRTTHVAIVQHIETPYPHTVDLRYVKTLLSNPPVRYMVACGEVYKVVGWVDGLDQMFACHTDNGRI
ncbi:MAG: hypothetical protein ACK4SY_08720 [Pyrobaculum sp.]